MWALLLIVASFRGPDHGRSAAYAEARAAISGIIVYAYFDAQYPTLALNITALLPLNILRLAQMMKLVRRVRSASQGDHTMDCSLKPSHDPPPL